ncbi:hypothetical protein [Streptomonospora salina]|uniref:Uncharacterized protein n=1 Tax=Streptomonospora salina TaxID=104205 RepID=A0A841E1X7_9ACTN|nr:hypothetical protein [Streptomonospora salina]MBB5997046.1 hypothetical protein [Streptomonospora salina]
MSDTQAQAPAHSPSDRPAVPARIRPVLLSGGAILVFTGVAVWILRRNGRYPSRGRHRRPS